MANNRNINGEILTLETAEKLARVDQAIEYIQETLKQAFTTYKLSSDAVVQLEIIQNIILGDNNGSRK